MAEVSQKDYEKYVRIQVNVQPDGKVSVHGQVVNPSLFSKMEVYAPHPINRMTSYTGSGLPFPCAAVAFDNTPSYLQIPKEGNFNTVFQYPNGFLTQDATNKVAPSVFVKLTYANPAIQPVIIRHGLDDPLPLRTLVDRPNHKLGPIFYSAKEDVVPIASAEQTMRNIAIAKVKYGIAM
jgi:hypothetical protein